LTFHLCTTTSSTGTQELERIFVEGYAYKKAGVALYRPGDGAHLQGHLFREIKNPGRIANESSGPS
jgi:hypothetical protein